MRVAWLMTDYPRNAQTFNHREIVSLEAAGVSVAPIAVNPPDPADLAIPEHRRASERTCYLKRVPWPRALGVNLAFGLAHPLAALRVLGTALRTAGSDPPVVLKRLLHLAEAVLVLRHCRTRGVRHVHAQFGGTASTIAMLAAEAGRAVDGPGSWTWSFTLHGLDLWNDPGWLLRQKVASASAVVCAADFTRAQVLRIAATDDWPKVRVVRCGIDLARFPLRPERPARAPGEPLRIVGIGRLAPEKGLTVLLEALCVLHGEGVAVSLELIGSGPERGAIEAAIARLGLQGQVSLLGEQPAERVPGLLAGADLLCLPSFAEGVPMAIVEAMAIGVPVVSTQVGGIPEMVLDGRTGRCVPAGRADLLAEAMAELARDPERAARLAAAARERVVDIYDARRTTGELKQLLEVAARDALAHA